MATNGVEHIEHTVSPAGSPVSALGNVGAIDSIPLTIAGFVAAQISEIDQALLTSAIEAAMSSESIVAACKATYPRKYLCACRLGVAGFPRPSDPVNLGYGAVYVDVAGEIRRV